MTDSKQEDANSKKMIMAMVACVFVANLIILGYAVQMSTGSHGDEHAAVEHTESTTTGSGAGEPTGLPTTSGGTDVPPAAGSTPAASGALIANGKAKYGLYCATCHGDGGKGDGLAAASLDPKPRNHTDPVWQAATTDDSLRKVITMGGLAIGLSPTMPPNPQLTGDDLESVVQYIRSLDSSK